MAYCAPASCPLDHPFRRWRLYDRALTLAARIFGAHRTDHTDDRGHPVECFGGVLTDPVQPARTTGTVERRGLDDAFDPLEMLWQRTDITPCAALPAPSAGHRRHIQIPPSLIPRIAKSRSACRGFSKIARRGVLEALTAFPRFVRTHVRRKMGTGLGILDQLPEARPTPRNPTLEGAFRDPELACGLLDRDTFSGKQHRIALVGAQFAERPSDVAQRDRLILAALDTGHAIKGVLRQAGVETITAMPAKKAVAHDHPAPRSEIAARFEPVPSRPAAQHRLLGEIIGIDAVSRQETRVCAQRSPVAIEDLREMPIRGGNYVKDCVVHGSVANELAYVRRVLDTIGEELVRDPIMVQRHGQVLQSFDIACQLIG
jgi:hypothetical protein